MSTRAQRKAYAARQQASRNEFLWREGVRREAQLQRDFHRDAAAADDIRDKTSEKVKSIYVKAETDAGRAIERIEREFGAEEKKILSAPRVAYTGATKAITSPIVVWHWNAVIPTALAPQIGVDRFDAGPIAVLRPGGGLQTTDSMPDVCLGMKPSLQSDPIFIEWARGIAKMWDEFTKRYGALLSSLRDDDAFAELSEAVGISHTKSAEEPMNGTYGAVTRKVSLVRVPELTDVSILRDGLILTFAHRAGDSAKNWASRLDPIRAGFKSAGMDASKLTIGETRDGDIQLRFHDVDPFQQTPPDAVYDPERFRSRLGITSTGQDAWIAWAGSSGMVVGGVPGSGKTASMLPVFAAMKGEAELHVFDGKAGYDLHPLRIIAATYDNSGDVSAPLETLRKLDRLRVLRAEALYAVAGNNNFWNTSYGVRKKLGMVPIVLVLDEVQTWTDTSGLSKDEKRVTDEITALIRSLIQKGRSAGIVTVLTTQKPDATTIPTKIRDNASLKLSFRVSTIEQAVTILGKQAPGAPDPTDILISQRGRCVMETEGHGIQLIQAGYTSPVDLEEQLQDAEPVEDQWVVANRLLGRASGAGTKSASASHPDPADETSSRGRSSQTDEFAAPTPGNPETSGNSVNPEAPQSVLDITSLSIEEREALLRQLLSIPVTEMESAPASAPAPKAAPKPKTDLKPPSPEGW